MAFRSTPRRSVHPHALERLEPRKLLSIVTITGTDGPNEYTVDLDATGALLHIWEGPAEGEPDFVHPVGEVDGLHFDLRGGRDTVDLREIAAGMPTTLSGGTGNDAFTVGGHAYDPAIRSPVTVDGGAGHDTLWFADTGTYPHASEIYRFTRDTFTKGDHRPPTTFIGIEDITLDGDPYHNYVYMDAVALGVTVRVFGNFGGELLHVGRTDDGLAAIEGHVELMDGARLSVYDTASDADATFTIGPDVIALPYHAATLTYGEIRDLRLYAGGGDDVFNVTGHSFIDNIGVWAGDGDDTFNVGDPTAGVAMPTAAFVGEGGHDLTNFNDQANNVARHYTLTNGTLTGTPSLAELYGTTEVVNLNAGAAADTITLRTDSAAAPLLSVHGGGGADTIDVRATFGTTSVAVDGGAARDRVLVNGDAAGTAAVRFDASQDLAELRLFAGGRASLTAGGDIVLLTELLALDPGAGPLDLADNAMVLDYTGASPIASIQSLLNSGYNGGAWNGAGINSAVAAAGTRTALGYAEASDLFTAFPATFAGVSVDETAVLVRHTFYGDANLDGVVNLRDFNRLAANFGQPARRWSQGDFDFDADADLDDFNRLAANFGAGTTPGA